MVTQTRITKKRPDKNGSAHQPKFDGTNSYQTGENWPLDFEADITRNKAKVC